jgi:ABC-type nitrate/sulfonate/bicarbonate transport system permease component
MASGGEVGAAMAKLPGGRTRRWGRRGLATLKRRAPGVGLIIVLMVWWEIAAINAWVPGVSMPPVTGIAVTLWELWASGEILGHLMSSLGRMAVGYVIAIVAGVALGMAMGVSRFFYNLLEPLLELLRPIPAPAYIPIAILFLGIGNEMKVFMVALAAFFPVLINTYSGVNSVDPIMTNTARTFGLSRFKTLRRVVLPATAPYIFSGMRVSLAVALILVVISEMVAADRGIGFFILNAQRGFRVREMYAGVVTLAVVGYLLNRVFVAVEGRVLAWHYGYSGNR